MHGGLAGSHKQLTKYAMQHSIASLARGLPWATLILDAKPAMTLVVSAKGLGNNSVSKGKEGCLLASAVLQGEVALQVLIVQHVLNPISSDISA